MQTRLARWLPGLGWALHTVLLGSFGSFFAPVTLAGETAVGASAGAAPATAAEAIAPDHWLIEVIAGGAPAIEDLRDREPPEPLDRALAAGAALAPGQVYLARLPRVPRLLVPRLCERGLAFAVEERPDGAAILRLEKPA